MVIATLTSTLDHNMMALITDLEEDMVLQEAWKDIHQDHQEVDLTSLE